MASGKPGAVQNLAEAPVPFAEAVQLGKRGGVRPGAGRPKKGEQREVGNQPCDARLKYGTAPYFLARIHRDHPEIAALLYRLLSGLACLCVDEMKVADTLAVDCAMTHMMLAPSARERRAADALCDASTKRIGPMFPPGLFSLGELPV